MKALRGILTLSLSLASISVVAEELPTEPIPSVTSLPAKYPANWLFVHDTNFYSLIDGKVLLIDVSADTRNYKGAIGAAQFASFIQGAKRNELYVAETFYSRGVRGERTDVLTIYDTASLAPITEIELPGTKRSLSVTQKASLQLSRNERFLFVYNFTPAASVTIVDIDNREILNDIDIPGCSLVYPMGEQSFATMCGNGGMIAFTLDDTGSVTNRSSTEIFNDIDNNALFLKTTVLGGINYYPSFKGGIQAVDLSSDLPSVSDLWSITDENRSTNHGWRPAGWQVITSSEATGFLYLLMQPDAKDGSHKDGGSEVWIIDPNSQATLHRLPLKTWGVSIEMVGNEQPLLAVANAESELDIYDPSKGTYLRTIGGKMAANPFVMHAVR